MNGANVATEEPYADLISDEIKKLEAVDQRGACVYAFLPA